MKREMTFDERIAEFNKRIKNSNRIVFFSGAGVSTESGIKDFRSKDGLYNQRDAQFEEYKPEYLLSHECLTMKPNVFYEFYRQKMDCRDVEPNITHFKMAEIERSGKQVSVITQNIDGLHQKAGSRVVYEIHGTTKKNYCANCKKAFDEDFIFESDDKIPCCPDCGGLIRPDVTLYNESPPDEAWNNALASIFRADLVVVCGTSLTVYPAASLLRFVDESDVVIINRDSTPYDKHASLVFHENLGEVFKEVIV